MGERGGKGWKGLHFKARKTQFGKVIGAHLSLGCISELSGTKESLRVTLNPWAVKVCAELGICKQGLRIRI